MLYVLTYSVPEYYFNQGVVCDKFTDTGVKIYFPELESYLYVSLDTYK